MKHFRTYKTWVGFLLSVACAAITYGGPPDWLLEVSKKQYKEPDAGAVVLILCDDRNVVVSDDNRLKITHRYAVRILRKSGCAEAVAQVPFIDGDEAVVSSHAWIVRGGRQIKPKNKVEWLDVTLEEGRTVFTEARMMRADYTDFVIEGDFFGYETVVVGDLHFA